MRATIITLCTAALLLILRPAIAEAESLRVVLNGDQLQLKAPDFRFLSTEAQERLHDGATVIYAFRVSVATLKNGEAAVTISYHCVFSFDIFEEKYKVFRREPGYRSALAGRPSSKSSCGRPLTNIIWLKKPEVQISLRRAAAFDERFNVRAGSPDAQTADTERRLLVLPVRLAQDPATPHVG